MNACVNYWKRLSGLVLVCLLSGLHASAAPLLHFAQRQPDFIIDTRQQDNLSLLVFNLQTQLEQESLIRLLPVSESFSQPNPSTDEADLPAIIWPNQNGE